MTRALGNLQDTMEQLMDQDLYRRVIGTFASGVTVITTEVDGERHGSTASAVSSLSMDPPMLLICLNQTSTTAQAIRRSGRFVVNVLADGQGDLAYHFAGKSPDKFVGLEVTDGARGPVLPGCLAHMECDVVDMPLGGTHIVFFARVVNAQAQDAAPLAYFRGQFGGFVAQEGQDVHQRLRALVLSRELPLDRHCSTDELVELVGGERAAVVHSASRLIQEGLLRQVAPTAYEVTPFSAEVVAEALRARAALTLGAVACVVGTLSDEQVERVRSTARRASVEENPSQSAAERSQSIIDFHESLISLSDNALILETYRRLSVPSTLARVVSGTDWSDLHRKWSRDRTDLADVLATRDFEAVRTSISEYTHDLIDRCSEIIAARGGRI